MDTVDHMRQLFVVVASFVFWPVFAAFVGWIIVRLYFYRTRYRKDIYSVCVLLGLILSVYFPINRIIF